MTVDHLATSAATAEFRAAWEAYRAGRPQDRIVTVGYAPRLKVERVLRQLLEVLPEHPLEKVVIDARSGCSNFTGRVIAEPEHLVFEFDWDCAWKAREEGLFVFGIPDQQRAARIYGHRCFRVFERVE